MGFLSCHITALAGVVFLCAAHKLGRGDTKHVRDIFDFDIAEGAIVS